MAGKAVFDIGLDGDNDLKIVGGDFVIVESTAQHQQLLLATNKGEWKENPTVGVWALGFVDDEGPSGLLRAIRQGFLADGMTVDNLAPNPNSATDSEVRVFEQAYYE